MIGNYDCKCLFYEELDVIFYLSKKLNFSKKLDLKFLDVVELKWMVYWNLSIDIVMLFVKVVFVLVMFIFNNGGKVLNEVEKFFILGLFFILVLFLYNFWVSINLLVLGYVINYLVKFYVNFFKRN